MKLVGRCEKVGVFVQHRVFDEGLVLARAEDEPEGRVVARLAPFFVVKPDVHIHLPDVAVGQLAGFEVYQHEAFQESSWGLAE